MAAVILPPSPYKLLEEFTLKEAKNKIYDLKRNILRLYGKMQDIAIELGDQPPEIPEEYLDLPDAKPYPEENTPNMLMRSFAVDGSIERDYYNAQRSIEECQRVILNIQSRIAEMAIG